MDEVLHEWAGERGSYRIVRREEKSFGWWSVEEFRDGKWKTSMEENAFDDLLEETVRIIQATPPTAQESVLS